jgi:hypothetical protein
VGALKPAGQVTPSPKPFHPDGAPLNYLPTSKWTPAMTKCHLLAYEIGLRLLEREIEIHFANDPQWPFNAVYGGQRLIFNVGRLGYQFFENQRSFLGLLIHELAHEKEGDHLSEKYYDALTNLGAAMVCLALEKPGLFR